MPYTSNISRALRTAVATAALCFIAAPASAQLPSLPHVPIAVPGETGITLPDQITDVPDILGKRGHHQGTMAATSATGEPPNDPAYEPVISGDGRINRYLAFTSSATNIVGGSGGKRNLYVTKRAPGWSKMGNAWRMGKTILISRGRGGPANGDSWSPSFSGFDQGSAHNPTIFAPKCLAFVSDASNLSRSDGNGRADAFIKRMPSGSIKRIPTPSRVSEVAIDGQCREFAYVAGGALYWAKTNGKGKRRIMGGGIRSVEVSANGETIVFERDKVVYSWVLGKGTRRIGAGTDPSSEEWGRHVAYTGPDGRIVFDKITAGAPEAWCKGEFPRRLGGGRCGYQRGSEPSMTAGGHFAFYADGANVTGNIYHDISYCPVGTVARQVSASAHGNYAAYACSNGRIYMSYVGAY